MNARNTIPGLAKLLELPTGMSAKRKLPTWASNPFQNDEFGENENLSAVIFADCFNRYFEPENLRAAANVLSAAHHQIDVAKPIDGKKPLCCGRTFLASGLVEEAKFEAQRMIDSLLPYIEKDIPIIGLEPSCLLTLRDEILGLLPGLSLIHI